MVLMFNENLERRLRAQERMPHQRRRPDNPGHSVARGIYIVQRREQHGMRSLGLRSRERGGHLHFSDSGARATTGITQFRHGVLTSGLSNQRSGQPGFSQRA